jgi:hypothetical protein
MTLIVGIIAVVYHVQLPTEPYDAALAHHHEEAQHDTDEGANK